MNPPPVPPFIRPPTIRPWVGVGIALLLFPIVALGVIALGVASYFHLSSDTRALRDGLMKASGAEWRQHIGLNIGSVTLGVVRAGLSLVPLDINAREAVEALRGVEVGIYEWSPGTKPPDSAAMLTAADAVLSARGWERLVGVQDGEELVSVYVPGNVTSARQGKCCILVFDGRQMVLVSARADIEPLLQFLRNQSDLRARMRSWAARRTGL